MRHPKVWWQSWPVALIALATLCAGIIPALLPQKKPKIVEPEAEVYLNPTDGHGITIAAPPPVEPIHEEMPDPHRAPSSVAH
jgi:hypothetical protein